MYVGYTYPDPFHAKEENIEPFRVGTSSIVETDIHVYICHAKNMLFLADGLATYMYICS